MASREIDVRRRQNDPALVCHVTKFAASNGMTMNGDDLDVI
jgi:hypothetical protein